MLTFSKPQGSCTPAKNARSLFNQLVTSMYQSGLKRHRDQTQKDLTYICTHYTHPQTHRHTDTAQRPGNRPVKKQKKNTNKHKARLNSEDSFDENPSAKLPVSVVMGSTRKVSSPSPSIACYHELRILSSPKAIEQSRPLPRWQNLVSLPLALILSCTGFAPPPPTHTHTLCHSPAPRGERSIQ